MKITDSFDARHSRSYVLVLMAMAFASALMLVAAFMDNPNSTQPVAVRFVLALASLLAATAGYLSVRRLRYSFPLLGLAAVVFAASLWAFGAPTALVLVLALPALLMSVIAIIYRGRVNQADEPE